MQRQSELEFRKGVRQKLDDMEAGFQIISGNRAAAVEEQRSLILELGSNIQELPVQRLSDFPMLEFPRVNALAECLTSGTTSLITSSEEPRLLASPDEDDENIPATKIGSRHSRKDELGLLRPLVGIFEQNMEGGDFNSGSLDSRPTWGVSPSENTFTAVCLAAFSNQKEIPSISYFCDLWLREVYDQRRDLMTMLRSLIAQMALIMLEVVDSSLDFSQARFERIEDPSFSIDAALQLLRDLRSYIEVLENRDDRQQSRDLFRLLHLLTAILDGGDSTTTNTAKFGEHPQHTTKICFTANSYVDVLARLVGDDQLDKIEYSEQLWSWHIL
ncbi:hypothetical protein BDW59DRAFT_162229 [Aspergillus cavernicola]|uniref:Uncharacterized protein n=1 Tax=Aspergillus cavernicola TaxID=176166 RepID=A0ABR4IAN1_9EURO